MSVRKSLIWTSAGQLVLFASQMASQIIVSRQLTPYLVGIAAIAFSITDFINLMQTFGLRNFLIREVELSSSRIRTAFTINFLVSILTFGLVLAVAYWGSRTYNEPGIGKVLHITALIPLVMSFELVPGALLQRHMQFGSLAIINSSKAFVTAASTVALVFMGQSYMSIGYGALAGAVTSAVLTMLLGRTNMQWGLGLHDWRKISAFGLHMFGITGISTVSIRLAELLIGKMLGLSDLALYSRASALNNLLWTNIHSVFTRVVFSSMAEERRSTGSIRVTYLKTVDMVTALLWPAFAGLAIFAGPVIETMYGPKWLSAAPVLSVFALAGIGLTSITMTWEVFVVCEKTKEQTKLETARSLLTLAITLAGATFGIVGAALGRLGDALVSMVLYRQPLTKYTTVPFSQIVDIYRRNAILTVAAVIPAVVLMAVRGWSPYTGLGWVFAATAAGIALWVVAVQRFHSGLYQELKGLFGAVSRRVRPDPQPSVPR
jgi:O-antigen/teichoic acid export membrane protein